MLGLALRPRSDNPGGAVVESTPRRRPPGQAAPPAAPAVAIDGSGGA